MTERFIYVFDEKSKEALLKKGCVLLKADQKNKIFVFENKMGAVFDLKEIKFATSNTLTF